MPRIAIVGSCITRDLWPIHGGGAERLLYISRTSLPSLLAPAIDGFRAGRTPPGDLHRHEFNALVADLQKTALARLVALLTLEVRVVLARQMLGEHNTRYVRFRL